MINNLLNNVLVTRVLGAQADGTGTASSAILDMTGYSGVMFIAKFDDVDNTAVLTLTCQQNTANSASGMATLDGSATYTAEAADADDDLLVLDIVRPRERYVRAQVVIGTGNAILGSIVAIQYGAESVPITQGTTVLDSDTLTDPDEA
jgi:hypothetical protein